MVLDVNDKPKKSGTPLPPESPTGKVPTKGLLILRLGYLHFLDNG